MAAGIGIGAWASALPLVAENSNLDKGQLGLVLLCFAMGAILLMLNVGRYIDRVIGNETLSICGGIVFGASFLLIPFLEHPVTLGAGVLLAGAGFGTLDVAMNTGVSRIEQLTGRHLMSSFHAIFSIGNLAGALLVGQLIGRGGGLLVCLGTGGGLIIVIASIATILARASATTSSISTLRARKVTALTPSQRSLIALLGAIAFLAMLAEGGVMDWTAIYMIDVLGMSNSHGAYAFAIFAGAMSVGRLTGDFATHRFGRVPVVGGGSVICAIAIVVLLLAGTPFASSVALALCGLGVANVVPAVFASAGHIGGNAAGRAISMVTTVGYSGLLLGPALLGFVAQATTLVFSFILILLAFLIIAILSLWLSLRLKSHS